MTGCGTLAPVATTATWTQDRIDAAQAQIDAYEAAVLFFATNGLQQAYRYDTGQTIIRVERMDGAAMQSTLDKLYNRHAVLCVRARQTSGAHNSRGAW